MAVLPSRVLFCFSRGCVLWEEGERLPVETQKEVAVFL